ncbi:MAG TPA: DNRLRE domain-containing protein, partial [Humisphaera sp.]
TAAGTFAVADLPADGPARLGGAGGVAYVVAYTAEGGDVDAAPVGTRATLWRSDGTAGGTAVVRELNLQPAGTPGPAEARLEAAGGLLFFADGTSLWRSDGTTAGTVIVDGFEPAPYPLYGRGSASLGDAYFYTVPSADPAAAARGGRDVRFASAVPPQAPSDLSEAAEAPPPAAAVTALRVRALAAATAPAAGTRLSWSDNSARESGFVVERSGRADFGTVDGRFFAPADATGLTDPGGDEADYYRVRAVNAAGESAFAYAGPAAPPPAFPTTVSVRAAADAHARDGTYAAKNFGTATAMEVRKSSTAGNQREAFLRFDLTTVASAAQITGAKVRVYGRLSAAAAGGVPVALYPVASTAWAESGLTWNARPAAGTTALAARTVASTAGSWYEFDVTAYLRAQKQAGAKAVAFALRATAFTTPWASFNSDEGVLARPELLVRQTPPPPAVSVSSSAVTVGEGRSAGVTVKLAAAPATTVTVTVARTAGDGDLTAGPLKLTFTPANWYVPQPLSVAAAQDADAANGTATFTLSGAGLLTKTFTATEADDDRLLRASADSYVRDGSYAGTNYGAAGSLFVRASSTAGNTRRAVLKFDLASVSTVSSAVLRLYGRVESTAAASVRVQAFAASSSTWTESGVTWNNKPSPTGSSLGEVTVSGTTAKWYTIDLTAWLAAQKAAGRTTAALVLTSPAATAAAAVFNTDEATGSRPELFVKA